MTTQLSLRSLHNRGGHAVKLHQQHLLACFSPLQKSGYPAATLQHSHPGHGASELSPVSAPWTVRQSQGDRMASTVFPAGSPSMSYCKLEAVKETVFNALGEFSLENRSLTKNPNTWHSICASYCFQYSGCVLGKSYRATAEKAHENSFGKTLPY